MLKNFNLQFKMGYMTGRKKQRGTGSAERRGAVQSVIPGLEAQTELPVVRGSGVPVGERLKIGGPYYDESLAVDEDGNPRGRRAIRRLIADLERQG